VAPNDAQQPYGQAPIVEIIEFPVRRGDSGPSRRLPAIIGKQAPIAYNAGSKEF
jgi:hypothetical protein